MKIFPVNSHYKTILKIALPAIAGHSAQMIVSMVDAALVGRLEAAEYALAAMGISVLATWAIVSFFSSLATGTHILIARKFGQKNYDECSVVLFNSLLIALSIGVLIAGAGMVGSDIIAHFFAKDEKVGDLAGEFIFYRLIGLPFFLLTVSFRGFYFGIGNTRLFMVSGITVNLLNILFNYMFIYGKFGAPEMGVAGSGFGSSLATICDAFFYLIMSLRAKYITRYRFFHNLKFNSQIIKSIFKLSLPVSFQNVFILVGFLSFVAITGLIGIVEQAATQAIISTLFMSFLPCFGFGIAVQTLVGNNLGRGKEIMARLLAVETAKIATYYTLFLAILYVLLPEFLLRLITDDIAIIEIAKPAMRIAGIAQFFYASGIVLANALQAVGKTRFVMFAEVLANLVAFVPISYFLGVYLNWGLLGAWLGLPVYILLFSGIIILKFAYGKWQVSHIFH